VAVLLNKTKINPNLLNSTKKTETAEIPLKEKVAKYAAPVLAGAALLYILSRNSSPTNTHTNLSKLSDLVPGTCPIADRHSQWTIMKLLYNKIVHGIGETTEEKEHGSFNKNLREGTIGRGDDNIACGRRNWLDHTNLFTELRSDPNEPNVFNFIRHDDADSPLYPTFKLTCTSETDTLTCKGAEEFVNDYTATESKSGIITETYKEAGKTIREESTFPDLLYKLITKPPFSH
jgi:hypothetical protein